MNVKNIHEMTFDKNGKPRKWVARYIDESGKERLVATSFSECLEQALRLQEMVERCDKR